MLCSKKDYFDIEFLEKKIQVHCKKCRYFTWFKEPSLLGSNYFKLTYMCKLLQLKNTKDYEIKL